MTTHSIRLLVYNTTTFDLLADIAGPSGEAAACDSINSVSFHPYSSMLITSTGQRHFKDAFDDNDDDSPVCGDGGSEAEGITSYSSGVQLWSISSNKIAM